MNENLSFSVFTADIVSLLLLGTLYLSNWQRMSHDRDIRIVARMMAITAVSNVADCCVFICENGGTIFQEEQCIAKNPMPRALAEEIANDMWTRSEGQGEVMLSGQNTAYLMERGLGMLQRVQFVGNHYQIIHSPAEVPEDITKVSVYLHEGVENYVERFVPRWKQANCAVAGPFWIDTTFANKGIGVQCVCRILGIDLAQVMAFGDNYNDETMLDVVGVPYIMDNAAAPLRAKYQNHTPRPEDVLAQLLAQQP